MSERVQVKEVWNPDSPEPYQGQNGMTYSYKLTLEDGRYATIAQKADTPPPFPGQVLEADIRLLKEGGKMHKLFNVKRGGSNGVQPAQPASQAPSQPQDSYEVLDTTQRLIIRQNALNRATDEALAKGMDVTPERVDYFESLIWKAASKEHEQKALVWAETEIPQQVPQVVKDPGPIEAATLGQILKEKHSQGVTDLVFRNYVTSLGAESVNDLSEGQGQQFLAWLTEERAA